ncbi:hypothetical protein DO71_6006 [Burkholderia pseudomallei]|nr:hypothetical protein DO71_6006 [Burkholderia pseudomallei]
MSAWRGGRLLTRLQSDVSMVSSLQEERVHGGLLPLATGDNWPVSSSRRRRF